MSNVTMRLSVDQLYVDDDSFCVQLLRVCQERPEVKEVLRTICMSAEGRTNPLSGDAVPGTEVVSKPEQVASEQENSVSAPAPDVASLAEMTALQSQVSELQKEKQKLEQDIYEKEGLISTLQDEKTNLTAEKKELEEKVSGLQDEKRSLGQTIQEKNTRISEQKDSIKDLESQVSALQDDKEGLASEKKELQERVSDLQLAKQSLETRFAEFERQYEAWRSYESLSAATRSCLEGLFKQCRNAMEMLAFGAQEKEATLTSLWEQCLHFFGSANSSRGEFQHLRTLFEYFLEMNLVCDGRENYERIMVHAGEVYSSERGMQTVNKKIQGKVSEVLLSGFRDMKTNRVIRKCLVVVS